MRLQNGTDRRGQQVFGILDIGTSKIAAAVVVSDGGDSRVRDAASGLRVAGLGLQRSKGVKAGVLTDLDEAELAVRAAISQAERAAGVTLDSVSVSVSCGRLKSTHFAANADITSGVVTDEDIVRMMEGGRAYAERDGRTLIHMNRLGFRLDGAEGTSDPKGLAARHLSAHLHAVTADEAPLRNLLLLIERCYLGCDGLVATPYASALATTTEEERSLGVTVIDFGAGTTSIGLFTDGRFGGAEVVPVGSQHITFDIAKALQTPLVEAERIKTLYGTLVSAQSDEHETISYPLAGEEDGAVYQTTKARLTDIIRPRVAQILGLVRERLVQNGASAYAGDKVVLTGGASQLLGSSEFMANQLGRPVRLGRPLALPGLPDSLSGPQFSALAGLALASGRYGAEHGSYRDRVAFQRGYFGRVGSWLKAGF
ncbi:MAG: cell division protein FtsA [Hyphomicrobium sp.]